MFIKFSRFIHLPLLIIIINFPSLLFVFSFIVRMILISWWKVKYNENERKEEEENFIPFVSVSFFIVSLKLCKWKFFNFNSHAEFKMLRWNWVCLTLTFVRFYNFLQLFCENTFNAKFLHRSECLSTWEFRMFCDFR